jgi:hypothetical protein
MNEKLPKPTRALQKEFLKVKRTETPRPELFDEELLSALRMRLPELSIFDYSLASWILRSTSKGR